MNPDKPQEDFPGLNPNHHLHDATVSEDEDVEDDDMGQEETEQNDEYYHKALLFAVEYHPVYEQIVELEKSQSVDGQW